MDLSVYNAMAAETGVDPEFIESHTQIPMGQLVFHQDILRHKAMWTANVWFDWRLWLCNHHSMLALCFAVQHHPYRTEWRVVTLLCTLMSSAMFISISCQLLTVPSLNGFGLFASRRAIAFANSVVLTVLDRSLMSLSICACADGCNKRCFGCCTQTAAVLRACFVCFAVSLLIGSVALHQVEHLWQLLLVEFVTAWIASYCLSLATLSARFV